MSNTFMTSPKLMFTSESVTEGHPDKLCDQISDAVLDACLEQDPRSRVACETATKTGFVALLGEITTNAVFNYDQLARQVICDIGYDSSEKGFDGNSCGVLVAIAKQSGDIAMGVDAALESRNGHQRSSPADEQASALFHTVIVSNSETAKFTFCIQETLIGTLSGQF